MPEQTNKMGIKKFLGNENTTRSSFNENFDIIDLMAQKEIIKSEAEPVNPTHDDLWIHLNSVDGHSMKRYNEESVSWELIGESNVSAKEKADTAESNAKDYSNDKVLEHSQDSTLHTLGNDVAIHVGNSQPDPSLYPNRKILFFNTSI